MFFLCLINAVAPKNKTKKLNAVTLKQRVDIYRKIDHNKKNHTENETGEFSVEQTRASLARHNK